MCNAGIAGDKFMEAFCRFLYKSLDELCELPISQYDLAINMSYLVSYMNSIVS